MLTLTKWLVFAATWLLHQTYRYRFFDVAHRRLAERGHPRRVCLMSLPKDQALIAMLAHGHQRFAPLCERNQAGRLGAFVFRRLGLIPVAEKTPDEASGMLEKAAAYGFAPVLFTEMPGGQGLSETIAVARASSVKILPTSVVASATWTIRWPLAVSLPKPFAKVVVCYGVPFPVDETDGEEPYLRQLFASRVTAVEQEAKRRLTTDDADALSFAHMRRGHYQA